MCSILNDRGRHVSHPSRGVHKVLGRESRHCSRRVRSEVPAQTGAELRNIHPVVSTKAAHTQGSEPPVQGHQMLGGRRLMPREAKEEGRTHLQGHFILGSLRQRNQRRQS